MAKETVLREFAKAALDAYTDVQVNGKAAEAAFMVAFLMLEMRAASSLKSPQDGLRLYQCMSRDVRFFPESLWQDAEFASSHWRRPVYSWSEPYKSRK